MSNPLLSDFNTPFESAPFDKIKNEQYKPAFDKLLTEATNEVNKIIDNNAVPDFTNTIVALEKVGERLSAVSKILFNLNSASTSEELQGIATEISPRLTEFHNSITLNEKLFERIKTVYNSDEKENLKKHQVKLLSDAYKQFIRSGAELSDDEKKKYHEISKQLSVLQIEFNKNVLAETNAYFMHVSAKEEITGLPEDKVEIAAKEAKKRDLEGWVFTLQFPSFSPYLKYADNRKRREELWRAYSTRCHKQSKNSNVDTIKKIVDLRLEKAKILGYSSYADYVLENRMAENKVHVFELMDQLLKEAKPLAKEECEELRGFAKNNGLEKDLMPWDISYWNEKLKKSKFDYDDEVTRSYFQLADVVNGVFDLSGRLFDLAFEKLDDVPVYNEDVEVYKVTENGRFKALLYLDFYARESKQGGAWMTDYKEQSNIEGTDIRPHVSLVFNFSKSVGDKPTLLSHQEVTTVLHEFGHALHGILSNVQYSSQAGTNVYRDFVELPSQLLENFGYTKEWLKGIAVHYKTKEIIPDELIDKIIASRAFFEGYGTLRQLSFGLTDLAWHTIEKPFEGELDLFEEAAVANTRLFPKIEGAAFSTAFSHIFGGGYASGYYGYKWAEVLDADAFEMFIEHGIYNREVATRFKEEILEKGGSDHPMQLYVNFKGKKPTADALLKRMKVSY